MEDGRSAAGLARAIAPPGRAGGAYASHACLRKQGEEVCGDSIQFTAGGGNVFLVLSDGLGSGIKASICSTLTVRIMLGMASAEMPLSEIVHTILQTLPTWEESGVPYAAFTVARIAGSGHTNLIVYGNPDPVVVSDGQVVSPDYSVRDIGERQVRVATTELRHGDAVFLISDGVTNAGLSSELRARWGWENAARFLAETQAAYGSVSRTVDELVTKVGVLYHGRPADDATILGSQVRPIRTVVVFTGPPVDPQGDAGVVADFLSAPGTHVVCGGTSTEIVERIAGKRAELDLETARLDIPPMGKMPGVDLITEGVLTLAKTIQVLRAVELEPERISSDRNAANELARTLLGANHARFIVGLRVDPVHQNPLLPLSISLRKYLVEELAGQLRQAGLSVEIEFH